MASSRELQRRADQARERLSDRLTELGDQLSPSAVIGDLLTIDYDKARQDVTQFLSKQVRGNPLAFALIAAGIGWLMISEVGGPSSRLHFGRGSRPRRARRTAKAGDTCVESSCARQRLVLALRKGRGSQDLQAVSKLPKYVQRFYVKREATNKAIIHKRSEHYRPVGWRSIWKSKNFLGYRKAMTRYKGSQSAKAADAISHFVDVVVPPGGLGQRLGAMYEFHARHGIRAQRGHGRHDANGSVVRWCFADQTIAAAFAQEFAASGG
jgi:hypothetical protein